MVEKEIQHDQYKEALFDKKQFWHGMNIWRSEGQEIYGMRVNKRKLCIWQHNQQLFANKAALRPVRQIIDDRLIRFDYSSLNIVAF